MKLFLLKNIGEPQIEISNTSKVRSWAVVKCFYEITKLDENTDKDEQDQKLQKSIKAWLNLNKVSHGN